MYREAALEMAFQCREAAYLKPRGGIGFCFWRHQFTTFIGMILVGPFLPLGF